MIIIHNKNFGDFSKELLEMKRELIKSSIKVEDNTVRLDLKITSIIQQLKAILKKTGSDLQAVNTDYVLVKSTNEIINIDECNKTIKFIHGKSWIIDLRNSYNNYHKRSDIKDHKYFIEYTDKFAKLLRNLFEVEVIDETKVFVKSLHSIETVYGVYNNLIGQYFDLLIKNEKIDETYYVKSIALDTFEKMEIRFYNQNLKNINID